MALINKTKKFIFIGNARCASTSMYKELGNISVNDETVWGGNGAPPNEYHMSLNDVLNQYSDFKNYFKFGFIRNPWARFLSAYFDFKKPTHCLCEQVSKYESLERFCLNFTKDSVSNDIHYLPLYNQITVGGKIGLDFVGKFENISKDFEKATEMFGSKTKLNIHFRKTNTSQNYKDYYNEETKNIVAEFYKKDIELFGYEF